MPPRFLGRFTAAAASRGLAAMLAIVVTSMSWPTAADAAPAAAAATSAASVEADLFNLTNASRNGSGVASLAADPRASEVARAWSQQMSSSGKLSHNPNVAAQVETYVTRDWQRIGENVGVGYSAKSLHDAFMNSPGHRANIMGDFNRLGVGASIDGKGRLWVTLVFIKARSAPAANLPSGNFDGARAGLGTVEVWGWAADTDTPDQPITIHLYVDGNWAGSLRADQRRDDIGAALPWAGPNHGWSTTLALGRGLHVICAYALDPSGTNPRLGCQYAQVGGSGFGSLDRISPVPGGFRLDGWAIDPDTTMPVDVHVYGNGRFEGWARAADDRHDVAASYPAFGGRHGYGLLARAGHGWTRLCTYAIDAQGGDPNRQLACAHVYRDARPHGNLDVVRATDGGIEVAGWVLDPDTVDATSVHVYIDGGWAGAVRADRPRQDVAATFPSYGANHGYFLTAMVSPGTHTVCVYGIDAVSVVENPVIGCRLVTVPA